MYDDITNEIYEEIKAKLMEPVFMNRYGTSLSMNMTQEYKKYLKENFVRLKNEFDLINKGTEDGITKDELIEYLLNNSKNSKLEFSPEYVDNLYYLMDVNKDCQITM
jgi:hypothetical protein